MKVIHIEELDGTDRDVEHGNWRSRRFVLAGDGVAAVAQQAEGAAATPPVATRVACGAFAD